MKDERRRRWAVALALTAILLFAATTVLREDPSPRAMPQPAPAGHARPGHAGTGADSPRRAQHAPDEASDEAKPTLTVVVFGVDGSAIEDALVYLVPEGVPGVNELDARTPHTRTDGNGTAILRQASGVFVLVVDRHDYLPAFRRVSVEQGSSMRLRVTLDPGASISGRVILPPKEGGTVPYVISYASASPHGPSEAVWRYPADETRYHHAGTIGYDKDSGRFSLHGLPQGLYSLEFRGPRALSKRLLVQAPAAGLEVTLESSASVAVRIVNWPEGSGLVARGDLYAADTAEQVSGRALRDPKGAVLPIVDGVPPGSYRLNVEVEGQQGLWLARADVTVDSPGQDVEVQMRVLPAPRLDLSLADGTPMDGFAVVYRGDLVRSISVVSGYLADIPLPWGCSAVRYCDRSRLSGPKDLPEVSLSSPAVSLALDARQATMITPPKGVPVRLSCSDARAEQLPVFVIGEDALQAINLEVPLKGGQVAVVPYDAVRIRVEAQGGSWELPLAAGRAHSLTWRDAAISFSDGPDAVGR